MSVTADQCRLNLQRAEAVRLARADLHRVVAAMSPKGGAQHVARLLQNPPEFLLSLPVRKLLLWIDRWGDQRAERLLADLGIAQRRDVTVGELTGRQVGLLCSVLAGASTLAVADSWIMIGPGRVGARSVGYPVGTGIKHGA